MNTRNYPQDVTLVSRRGRKTKLPIILGCLGVLGLLFVVIVLGGFFYTTTNASGQSVVFIRSPQDGERLEAGRPVQVRALARDDHKITRIELWVDGQLLAAQTSNTQSGINPFPLLTTWYPPAGAHTLIVRSFNRRGGTSQASIRVEAVTLADRDADGIADEADACPEQPGGLASGGCPDRDFDGIADAADACPDDSGLPDSGCPAPSAADRDGDGLLDAADACPDDPGPPLADGCRDTDGDGVGDVADMCPAEPGAGADGCPEPGGGDVVPEPEPGGALPDPGGEPPEPGSDAPEPGSGFDDMDFGVEETTALEVEAYELWIRDPYESIWCYVRLGDEAPRRYEFDALGDQYWDIAEALGGENSVRLLHAENMPLHVSIECWGSTPGGLPVALGEITAVHSPEEWDGRELYGAADAFMTRYHICSPSCGESAFPTPLLAPITTGPIGGGPYTLRWRWDGDNAAIDGFGLIVFTADESSGIDLPDPGMRSLDIADYMPACGEAVYFQLFAYRSEGDIRSPLSNVQHWSGDLCTYTANVTFTTLDVHNPPADEDGLHRPGPIYGEFWISNGSTVEALEFNACWCYLGPGMTFWGWCEGLKLQGGQYSINRDIFDWIEMEQASCLGDGCNSNVYYAPFNSSLSIPFEDGDDITIGGRIMDCDERSDVNDVLYQEQEAITINVDELEYLTEPIWRTLNGNHVNLDYFIRLGR